MTRPLIGLPGRRKYGRSIAGFPDNLHETAIDLYLADYARAVLAAGGLPVHIPMDGDPAEYVEHLNGVVLTGGADVDPGRYGADPDGNGDYEADRDELELSLYERAIDRTLPVLGICRGLQIMNVHHGGTLHQHVPEHARYDVAPDHHVHRVQFGPDGVLGDLYSPVIAARGGDGLTVNSLHHQTVDRVADGLAVTARADDGTVEGLEWAERDVIAVQWHPEMLQEPEPVFDWLVAKASTLVAG